MGRAAPHVSHISPAVNGALRFHQRPCMRMVCMVGKFATWPYAEPFGSGH
jgi:hypothetical protein